MKHGGSSGAKKPCEIKRLNRSVLVFAVIVVARESNLRCEPS